MPVLAVQQFRCKTCRDTGVVQRPVFSGKNPHNDFAAGEDGRSALQFNPNRAYGSDRVSLQAFPCAECPPEPPRKRDWVR